MVSESQALSRRREAILAQGRQLQTALAEAEKLLQALDIELSILDKLGTEMCGQEEKEKC